MWVSQVSATLWALRFQLRVVRLSGKKITHLKQLCPSSASLNRFSFLYISCWLYIYFLLFKLLMASRHFHVEHNHKIHIFKENKMFFIISKCYSVDKVDGKRFPQPGQREPEMRNYLDLTVLWTCHGTFSWLLVDVAVVLPQWIEPFLGRWT